MIIYAFILLFKKKCWLSFIYHHHNLLKLFKDIKIPSLLSKANNSNEFYVNLKKQNRKKAQQILHLIKLSMIEIDN